jgi:hypothetical protein
VRGREAGLDVYAVRIVSRTRPGVARRQKE